MKTKFKNHFRELFLTTLCFLLTMTYGYSQDQLVVKGTVKGQKDGVPIPYVNVLVKGTNQGSTTDFDGNYSIEASSDAVLVFSSIGFKTTEVAVDSRAIVNVDLAEDV